MALATVPQHLIMIGDPKQLPATVLSVEVHAAGRNISAMQRLMDGCRYPCAYLNIQYRMHPEILAFPNRMFYENSLITAPTVLHRAGVLRHDRDSRVSMSASPEEKLIPTQKPKLKKKKKMIINKISSEDEESDIENIGFVLSTDEMQAGAPTDIVLSRQVGGKDLHTPPRSSSAEVCGTGMPRWLKGYAFIDVGLSSLYESVIPQLPTGARSGCGGGGGGYIGSAGSTAVGEHGGRGKSISNVAEARFISRFVFYSILLIL